MEIGDRPLKIIVLGTRGFPSVQGGVETHCENLYPRLAGLGCDVTVITRRPYVDPGVTSHRGVRLVPLDCPRNKFLEAIVHTFKGVLLARKAGCDILHIHAVGPSLLVPLARILGLKVVMTHHGPDYERKKWNWAAKAVLKAGEWGGCVFANEVITISRTIAAHIKRKYGRDAVVIPNGVAVAERVETDGALKQFGLERGKYALAVGRFVPEKGFHDLLEAFGRVQGSGDRVQENNWKLVIVGGADHEDDYSQRLKEQAARLENVVLTGRLTGLPLQELYTHAGLFVLPSYYEGLPIVLLEAMSYGLSCVVSNIPANREVALEDSRYFKPGDVNSLSAKLGEFIARPMSEEERSQQIKQVAEKYNWDMIAAETLKVYRRVSAGWK